MANKYENKWEQAKKDMMKYGSSKSEGIEVDLPVQQRIFVDQSREKLVTIS
jgi:hypothetical protein